MASKLLLTKRQLAWIRNLRHKKHQLQHQAFIVAGTKAVMSFLQSRHTLLYLLTTSYFLQKNPTYATKYASIVHLLSPEKLQWLSPLKNNQEVLLVVRIPTQPPLALSKQQKIVVLDDISDPGNLGTILRIAHWYALSAIVASPSTVHCYNSKVVQASMGSLAHIPIYYMPLEVYFQQATKAKISTFGAVLDGMPLPKSQLPNFGSLVIGNEAHGINPAWYPYLNQRITIPRYGQAESLNAAIATAVICYQWALSG